MPAFTSASAARSAPFASSAFQKSAKALSIADGCCAASTLVSAASHTEIRKARRMNTVHPPQPFDRESSSDRGVQRRQLSLQESSKRPHRKLQTDVERPELGEPGAGFVEPHLVDQLLERQRVVGKQIHAPFPIVVADRSRDDLRDAAGVLAADLAMLEHHLRATI